MNLRRRRLFSHSVAGTLIVTMAGMVVPVEANAAVSKTLTCYQALLDVDAKLSPMVAASGFPLTLRVGPWDPAGTNLIVGPGYDAEVLGVRGGIELHLNCGTDHPVARSQMRSAFRFLVIHEYTHVLQRAYGFPSFDPVGEHSADCAAMILMGQWGWEMPSGARQGSHGGCPDGMYDQQAQWLANVGVTVSGTSAPPVKAPARRVGRGKIRR
jgi:hypothetical protein